MSYNSAMIAKRKWLQSVKNYALSSDIAWNA